VEQKYVHASNPISLVKAKHALLVDALKSFKVGTVHRCPERQRHCFIKLYMSLEKLTYLHSNWPSQGSICCAFRKMRRISGLSPLAGSMFSLFKPYLPEILPLENL
jgi:hypothetical protein